MALALYSVVVMSGCAARNTVRQPSETLPPSPQQTSAQQAGTSSTITKTAEAQPEGTSQEKTQNYLVIDEFDIKIPVTPEMQNDLSYKIIKGNSDAYVTFLSKKLTTINKRCANDDSVVNVLQFPNRPTVEEDGPNIGSNKQFPHFFISFYPSGNYCVMGENATSPTPNDTVNMAQEDRIKEDLINALHNAVLITE